MKEILAGLPAQLVEVLIYSAIALVFFTGLFKCILPLRRSARLFRRAIRQLELMTIKEGSRPVWQDPLFLGKPMQEQWGRFLMNAEQLDQRGLSCDTRDYINDEEVFVDYGHLQLAEVIPGLLTSLGILGTFIGLMRGLGNLDISTADSTMRGITQMIGGMTFAYGTSIAGVASSLVFNVLLRTSQGSAATALDDFGKAFNELVMQRPVDDRVFQKLHYEDQAAFLSRSAGELHSRLSQGIEVSIERAFVPIGQNISSFVMAQTQAQVEGLNQIVHQFVAMMNSALGGQFVQLAQTLSSINQAQGVTFESIDRTMSAADNILASMERTNGMTDAIIQRFDSYVRELSQAQAGNTHLTESMSGMLSGMHQNLKQQSDAYSHLLASQREVEEQMQQYAKWSGRVLEAVEKQSDAAMERSHEVANTMSASAKTLSSSYAGFVENISTGLARTMGMFEENLRDVMLGMTKQMSGIGGGREGQVIDLQSVSKLQQAMTDMTAALKMNLVAMEQMAEAT